MLLTFKIFFGCFPSNPGNVRPLQGVLDKAGLSLSDIDRIEINEAFASQYIACERE